MASPLLLASQAQIIRQMTIDLGLGTDPDDSGSWPIYALSEPDTPDSVITVYNTVGTIDGREMIEGEVYEHLGFMVRVRAYRNSVAFTKINAIADAYAKQVANKLVNVDGTQYIVCAVNRRGGLIDGGKESPTSERSFYTLNAIAAIYRTA